MFDSAEHDQTVFAQRHRPTDSLLADDAIAEHGLIETGIGAQRATAAALQEGRHSARFEAELGHQFIEVAHAALDALLQLFLLLAKPFGGLLARQLRQQLAAHFIQAAALGRLDAFEFDDVIAELSLDRRADLACLQGKQGIGKGRHISAAIGPA